MDKNKQISVADLESKDIFQIYEQEGEKYIHIFGYFYNTEGWKLVEPCWMIMPLTDFIRNIDTDENFIDDWYSNSKQFIQDFDTEEEVLETFNHFDNGHAPQFLEELSVDTPYGFYIH